MKRPSSEKIELVRGSGNVFRDSGRPNSDAEQLKAILAAEIIKPTSMAPWSPGRLPPASTILPASIPL